MASVGMLFFLFVIAFLIGSIPWGVIISKFGYKRDIRNEGSGNIGATNALRTLGKRGGALVFVLDFLKGFIAGAIGYFLWAWILVNPLFLDTVDMFMYIYGALGTAQTEIAKGSVAILCGSVSFLGCICGHIFSPWLGFRGGKGVAVGIGGEFFCIGIIGALIEIGIFLISVVTTRYVSLGSILAAIACPFIALWILWGQWLSFALVAIAAMIVLGAHHKNIDRLFNHTESKISVGKSSKSANPKHVK